MFNSLSDRLTATFKGLRGKGRLSEHDVNVALRDIRMALLDADVALPVVKQFVSSVRERALGEEVSQALNPAQQVVKIVNEELVGILGGETRTLRFAKTPPTVIMLAGLQGSGKTTLAGKLGYWLKGQGHTPLLVAADLQRPNAVTQLVVVGERAGVPVYAPEQGNVGGHDAVLGSGEGTRSFGDPVSVARAGIAEARNRQYDVVIVDTAGRLAVDEALMAEAADIRAAIQPDEVLFVIDAMIGQAAVETAQAFQEGVDFTGVVLSKLDGDARGGAALSVAVGDGPADHVLVDRRGREGLRGLPPRPDGRADPRHGRRADAHRAGREGVRPQPGRRDGAEVPRRGGLHLRRLPPADVGHQEDGLAQGDAQDDAGHAGDARPAGLARRARVRPRRGDGPVDDPVRADPPQADRRLAPGADREGAPGSPSRR